MFTGEPSIVFMTFMIYITLLHHIHLDPHFYSPRKDRTVRNLAKIQHISNYHPGNTFPASFMGLVLSHSSLQLGHFLLGIAISQ